MFGCGGEGFQRVNLACPRAILADAAERIACAFEARSRSPQNTNGPPVAAT